MHHKDKCPKLGDESWMSQWNPAAGKLLVLSRLDDVPKNSV